ncbi:MAG: PxKF domain-containing protein [Gemmatimonadaceae bacterium]
MRRRTTSALLAVLLMTVVVSCTGDRATSPNRAGERPSLSVGAPPLSQQIAQLFPEKYIAGASSYFQELQRKLRAGDYAGARAVADQLIALTVDLEEDGNLNDPGGDENPPTTHEAVLTLIETLNALVAGEVAVPDAAVIVIGADGSGLITAPSLQSAIRFPAAALQPGTIVTLDRATIIEGVPFTVPLEEQSQFGPYYRVEVFPSQPMGPGILWATCVFDPGDGTLYERLRIAKQKHDAAGVVIFPLDAEAAGLVTCTEPSDIGQADRPARRGLGGSAARFASRIMSDVLSVFAPTPAYAVHLGLGGKTTGTTTDTGFSLFGAVETLYDLTGFFPPVTNPGFTRPLAENRAKAGRSIPLKFTLGGNQGLEIFAAGSPSSAPYKCDGDAETTVDETLSDPTSSLHFDAGTGQYVYVWKTDAAWAGTCRKVTMTFKDGQQLSAFFQFTR